MADDVLGTGLAFPLLPSGTLPLVTGGDAVAQSLRCLLFTEPGERLGRPDYGCGLQRYLFASNTVATRTLLRQEIGDAIVRFEPRVRLDRVEVRSSPSDPEQLDVFIHYFLRSEPGLRTFTFPFYLDDRKG